MKKLSSISLNNNLDNTVENIINDNKIKINKKKKHPNVFNIETENAIIEIQNLLLEKNIDNSKKIDTLFYVKVYKSFKFIATGLVTKYKYYEAIKIYTIDQIINDTISELYIKIPKYNNNKGKAFSYFSIIAKNYLTQLSYNQVKDNKKTVKIDALEHSNEFTFHKNTKLPKSKIFNNISKEELYKQILQEFLNVFDSILFIESRFKTTIEKDIIDFTLNFLHQNKNSNYNLELVDKKFLIYYLQDNINVSRYYIIKTLNSMTIIYNEVKNKILEKYYYAIK